MEPVNKDQLLDLVNLSACLPVCLSACLPVCLSACRLTFIKLM